MKILTIVGTRPQFIKAAVVSRAFLKNKNIQEKILHTGQHYDFQMSEIFFQELGIPKPYLHIEGSASNQGEQTAKMLAGVERACLDERPDWVLVYGDTNSTLAGALAASKLHIPIAHVEAGLRSFNRKMPEEVNRVMTDHLSSLLFVPTPEGVRNLKKEGIIKNIHRVGDVMIDSIYFAQEKSRELPKERTEALIPSHPYFVLTLHRKENVDDLRRLTSIFSALDHSPFPFIFPVHPRTLKSIQSHKLYVPQTIQMIPPVSYLEMILLQDRSTAVWTDSGGIQKEAAVMKKCCFTLRDETEWVETVRSGWNTLLGADPEKIRFELRRRAWEKKRKPFPTRQFYGSGKASEKILEILVTPSVKKRKRVKR